MPILRLGFEDPTGPNTRIIAWWENSREAHGLVELDGTRWESVPGTGVVTGSPRAIKGSWDAFVIDDAAAARVRAEMDKRVGWKYGWDKILRFVFPWWPLLRHSVICSQLQYVALRAAGLVYRDDPVQTPREVHIMCNQARFFLDMKNTGPSARTALTGHAGGL